jgi:hypothetical protein
MVELAAACRRCRCVAAPDRATPSVGCDAQPRAALRAVDAGDAFRKVTCDELLASGVKHVRMLAAAANGVAVPAGRRRRSSDLPFELYGFCVGSGCAVERVAPASCVVVSMRDGAARDYL